MPWNSGATYGIDLPRLAARAAVYIDKILKGARPAEPSPRCSG